MSDTVQETIAEIMASKGSNERIAMLRSADELHLSTFICWLSMELVNENLKPDTCPKEIVEAYLAQFSDSIKMSVKATCIANGWEYDPSEDHNKKVRDEIMRENNL